MADFLEWLFYLPDRWAREYVTVAVADSSHFAVGMTIWFGTADENFRQIEAEITQVDPESLRVRLPRKGNKSDIHTPTIH